MFSTHYHRLSIDYRHDPKVKQLCLDAVVPCPGPWFWLEEFNTGFHMPYVKQSTYAFHLQVSLCHMACQVGKGDGGVEEVTFLYRLTPGACPKSYGVNVAKLAGKYL